MSRIRRSNTSAEVQRELEAIDAALAGRPVAAEHDSLAGFARELRAARPRADEQFLAKLDATVANGFERSATDRASHRAGTRRSRGRGPRRNPTPGWRGIAARPALGLALTALLAVAVVLPLALSGGGQRHAARSGAAIGNAAPAAGERAPAARAQLHPLVEKSPELPALAVPKAAQKAAEASTSGAASAAPAPGVPGTPARQVERAASLDVGVTPSAIDSKAHQVFTIVSNDGGYVRTSNVSSGGEQGQATFDIRVPSSNLSHAIAALSGLGHVRSENNATNDVTDQFKSLQHSLADLRAERASTLKQLARASEAQEEAQLKSRLRSIEARISQEEGSLRALSNRINYTSLALSLSAENAPASKHGELTPGAAARDAGKILEAALAVLVIAAAALLPLGAIALAAWMILTGTRRRLREQALDAS